jgi:hypothetical protein
MRFMPKNSFFFSKNIVMIIFFVKTSSSLSKKRQIFPPKHFKNHNIGPSSPNTSIRKPHHIVPCWNNASVNEDWPGVDVMITIFCDFRQFSAKKLAFFLNTNVTINFFQNLHSFVSSQKRQFFRWNFHNIGPWSRSRQRMPFLQLNETSIG